MNPFIVPGVVIAVAAAIRGMWSPCGLSMISSITPMSERARGHRFAVTGTWFTIGSVLGGVTTGAATALGAWLLALTGVGVTVRIALFTAAALVTVSSDLHLFGRSLPIHARQVNETWLRRFRAWAYAGGFGWQIGTGFATYVMTAGVYLTVVAGVASADPRIALGLGVVFGTTRGLLVFVAAGASDHTRLQQLHARIERSADASLDAAIGAQVLGLGLLAVTGSAPWVSVPFIASTAVTTVVRVRRRGAIVASVGEAPRVVRPQA